MENPTEKKPHKTSYLLLIVVMIIVFVCWLATPYLISQVTCSENAGVFGDMFGAINALFSGLAFAGIIFSIRLQNDELSAQRKEFEEQNRNLAKQTFESSFFMLLNTQRESVHTIFVKYETVHETGIKAIELLKTKIEVEFLKHNKEAKLQQSKDYLTSMLEHSNSYLHEYLFTLRTIVDYIEGSKLTMREREIYFRMIASRMPYAELMFLRRYSACTDDQYSVRMRTIIESYNSSILD